MAPVAGGLAQGDLCSGQLALVRDGRVWDVAPGTAGVRVGQRAREAQLACPGLRVAGYDPARHDRRLPVLWEALAAAAPFVEPLPGRGHEAFCAWTGSARPGRELAGLRRRFPEARVGLAANRLVARIACPERPGVCAVEPGEERGTLATLPVTLLWTLEAPVARRLLDLGLFTAGDVAATPEDALVRHLGADGHRARRAALGIDPTPVRAQYPPREVRRAESFDPPLTAGLGEVLSALGRRAAERLGAGEGACRLEVWALGEGGEARAERGWTTAQSDPGRLGRAAGALAGRLHPAAPVGWLAVTLAGLAPVPATALELWPGALGAAAGPGGRRGRGEPAGRSGASGAPGLADLHGLLPGLADLPGLRRGVSLDRYEEMARRFDPLLGGGTGAPP